MLAVTGLTKTYSGIPAVENVSFSIRPGETLGYLGPNGSGKSTTVKIIAGLLEPSSGQVTFHGEPIRAILEDYKRRIGYVPEEAHLYSFLTGWEYLEMVATLRGIPRAKFAEKAAALLQSLGMFPHRHSAIASYSKGMRQRILLIAAVMHDPELLILDEPFSGLDVTTTLIMRKAVQILGENGKAIFFCSPVIEVVEKICTHLLLLRKGRMAAYGTLDEVRRTALEATFLELTEDIDADRSAREFAHAACGIGA
jgi:ABC-2 type transport system ATP-binding protein